MSSVWDTAAQRRLLRSRTGGTPQPATCLPHRHEALSSTLKVVWACNPSAGEGAEIQGFLANPAYQVSPRLNERPCLKTKVGSVWRKTTSKVDLCPPHMQVYTYTQTYISTHMYTHKYAYTHASLHAQTYINTCVHMHVHTYNYVFTHIHKHAYVHTCPFIHTYMYTHTYSYTQT